MQLTIERSSQPRPKNRPHSSHGEPWSRGDWMWPVFITIIGVALVSGVIVKCVEPSYTTDPGYKITLSKSGDYLVVPDKAVPKRK